MKRLVLVAVLGALAARPSAAQRAASAAEARAAAIVTTDWLAAHLNDPDIVLLHVGDRSEYMAEHIPGAHFVTLQDISVTDRTSASGLTLELPDAQTLHDRLASLGIGDRSRVVVYVGNDWVSPATRVLFTLDYAGLGARSALLGGGMPQWKRDGQAVTAQASDVRPASLSPLRTKTLVVDAAWVAAHLRSPRVAIVDARDTVFYQGVRSGGRPGAEHRAGHIAGARSVYFGSVFDEANVLKPETELAALFAAAGIQPGDTVVTYCHIGQQATATLFAARTLGHPVLLYDGSFEDWSRRTELPVERTAPKPDQR